MNSFSINAYEHQPILDHYKQWLAYDLYGNNIPENLDDPTFLQKLSILQADGIRRDIGAHADIMHNSIQEASSAVRHKIQSTANLITSSLDEGFTMMNQKMVNVNTNLGIIGQGVNTANSTLQQGKQFLSNIDRGISKTNLGITQINKGINAIEEGIHSLNNNMIAGRSALDKSIIAGTSALVAGVNKLDINIASGINVLNRNIIDGLNVINSNISQSAAMLQYQLQQTGNMLKVILDELKIPESQRERRYHMEEGMKYFNKGMKSGDCLYFEDALEEFTIATGIERKDFFSWYYIGMIHLYSKDHLDLNKAHSAFDRYFHYADALPQRHNLFNEALMMKAECYYLEQNLDIAYQTIEKIIPTSVKAALRAMKYLSASGLVDKQLQAVEILKHLMQQNSYIIMQILEDYDIVCNEHILHYIQNEYKKKAQEDVRKNMDSAEKSINLLVGWPYVKNEFAKEFNSSKKYNIEKSGNLTITDYITINEKWITFIERIKQLHRDTKDAETFCHEGKVGFRTKKGVILIPCQYDDLIECNEGLYRVHNSNEKWGFVDKSGQEVVPCQWNSATPFSDGMAAVRNNDKWGFIDKSGRLTIPCQWNLWPVFGTFNEGLCAVVDENYYWGYIDKTGHLAIPFQFNGAQSFANGMAPITDKSFKHGFIDKSGHIVIPCQWRNANSFSEGLAPVQDENDKWGYIDKTGRIVFPCQWKYAGGFEEDMAAVCDTNMIFGFIDKSGRMAINYLWSNVGFFSEGLVSVADMNGKWGVVDKSGHLVIPCQWKQIGRFFEGQAFVKDDNEKLFKIDRTGKIVE